MSRLILTVYLACVWLIVDYPTGFLLYIFGACGYATLKLPYECRWRDVRTKAFGGLRERSGIVGKGS